jgi:hypothetical protein
MYVCVCICKYVCMYVDIYILIGNKEISNFNTQINSRSAFTGNRNNQTHRYSPIAVNIYINSYEENEIIASRKKQERD